MKTFEEYLDEQENRGGARKITNFAKLSVKPVLPAGPLRPDNIIPRPKPIKGTLSLNPFRKAKSTIVDINGH